MTIKKIPKEMKEYLKTLKGMSWSDYQTLSELPFIERTIRSGPEIRRLREALELIAEYGHDLDDVRKVARQALGIKE